MRRERAPAVCCIQPRSCAPGGNGHRNGGSTSGARKSDDDKERDMSVDIIRGATRKPGSSRMLADAIAGQRNLSGQLFIGYPTIATSEGPHSIDAS